MRVALTLKYQVDQFVESRNINTKRATYPSLMEVIDLVSSESDVIEILSSPPQTPRTSKRTHLSSSPLFDHEYKEKRAKVAEPNRVSGEEESVKQQTVGSVELISNELTRKQTELTAEPPAEPSNEPSVEPSVQPSIELSVDLFVEPSVEPLGDPFREPSVDTLTDRTSAACINVSADARTKAHADQALESPVDVPEPISEFPSAPKRRQKFKSPQKPAGLQKPSKVAPAPIMTRIKAGNRLRCVFHEPNQKWIPLVEQAVKECGCDELTLVPETYSLPAGVELILRVSGEFEDKWDEERQTFLKCDASTVDLHHAFVVISSSHFEVLTHMTTLERSAYFAQIEAAAPQSSMVFFFPEFAHHYKKQLDKFNREMRKRVNVDDTAKLASLPPLEPPPSEESFTNVQTELEVYHEIRAVYPRKAQEAAELMANAVIEVGFKRYSNKLDEIKIPTGGSVRSRSTPTEVSVESLTKVPGLPPRIAQKLVNEAGAIGAIRQYLGTSAAMRESRLKRFGKGSWNEALMALLESFDPMQTLGA